MCTQRRLRSAWASAQSDQSLCSAINGLLRTQCFFMQIAKTLIRLSGCTGWSESLLGTKVILLVLSCGGSNEPYLCLYLSFRSCCSVSAIVENIVKDLQLAFSVSNQSWFYSFSFDLAFQKIRMNAYDVFDFDCKIWVKNSVLDWVLSKFIYQS